LGSNAVKKTREERLMSRAELARKAGISPQTLKRVERGKTCRLETKRKILFALGYDLSEKRKIYLEE
jgi:DNA-binding XRE family transcriptional regulator